MTASRLLHALPANVVNGACAAFGIGLVYAIAGAVGGASTALAAASGAVYASLADSPNAPGRGWRRVLSSGVVGLAASVVVGALQRWPVALGIGIGLIGFASAMLLAWGPRAGPIAFVGVLAFVFTMATPPPTDRAAWLSQIGWTALGAGSYLGWSVALVWLLQRRYRTLALVEALVATAGLLRSRAARLAEGATRDGAARLKDWITRESAFDRRIQEARDLLFAAPAETRRETALLLLAVDLRETLLLGELDLDLLDDRPSRGAASQACGDASRREGEAPATRVRRRLAAALDAVAAQVEALADALRFGRDCTNAEPRMPPLADPSLFGTADSRSRLLVVLDDRIGHIAGNVARMRAVIDGAPAEAPLAPAELQLFVSGEGWPLAALAPHANLRSPVTRHAFRSAAALTCAYFVGLALPWASHPYWLVLSVAVVLRGSLEETLARRNARVGGTVVGCLIVLAIVQAGAVELAAAVFLVAAGIAHAFVTTRYGVTSAAASVMALLQAQMAHGLGRMTVVERLADTVLGALMAWAFSYVMPSWERHGLARLVDRVRYALAALARQVLQPQRAQATTALRLARREAYDALGALAAAAQRTSAEPRRVQLPIEALAALLTHAHALLAHLAAVKLSLARRGAELDAAVAGAALAEALARIERSLQGSPDVVDATESVAFALPLPDVAYGDDLLPWLQRRLVAATNAARRAAVAAQRLHESAACRM